MSMGLPMPARRFAVAGCLAFALVLILHTFAPSTLPPALTPSYAHHEPDASYFSPGKWLPPIFNPNAPERPPEFDENGQCLFLSPYDALSDEEKRRAETMVLEEVSPGVSRLVETTSPAWDQDVSALEAPYRRWMRNRQYGGDDDYAATASAGTGGDGSDLPRLTTPVGKSHPILGLLRHGDQKWKRMVESQSKTLDEAVDKYMSKWNRPPPKGFDLWWQFARSHKVLLPDELDSIMHALLPFYGLPIDTLQERLKEVEKIPETFTLIAHDGKIELQWNDDYARDTWFATRTRADKQINLMEPFLHMVGNFRATHTIHDQPTILLDHDRAAELINAAMARKVAPHHVEEDKHVVDWRGACAKSDPINTPDFLELPAADTFITNHSQAMNICHHPSYLENHGMLLEQKGANDHPMPHTKLYPIFVPSTTVLNRDIPVTPDGNDLGHDAVGHDPEWSRKSGKLYWRGKATGMNHNKKSGSKWRQSHRERLHFLANDRKKRHEEVLTPVGNTGQVETATYPLKELGDYYMDVKLSGGHWQCDWDDGTCSEMNDEIKWGSDDSSETSNWYKYVFDIDGNAWSSRFPRLMSSNNVVIKASVFPEWNTQSLPEWFAYVPSKMDYSDLFSILAFFRGTPSGKGSHDEVARRIALNGQCWVEKTWRTEDKQAYMFLLYLEYARVVSLDRDNGKMDFKVSAKHRPAFETELKEEKLAASMDDEVSKVRPDMDKSDPLAPGDFIEVDDDLSAAGGKVGSGTAESNANRVPDALSDEYLE